MTIDIIIYIAIAFIVGCMTSYLFFRVKSEHSRELLNEKVSSYEKELEVVRKNSLSVVTYPYKEEHGETGYFSDERRAEIGYKFQLFVSGVPCFDAHKVPVQVLSKKEVNEERIEAALKQAMALIETFASQHPSFIAYKSSNAAIEEIKKIPGKKSA